MTDYFLVTKEELDQIKNDCANPYRQYCENCDYYDETNDALCIFKGADVLMDEVMTRPLEAELKKEGERVLDKIVKCLNEQSESAELPCQDGWHTGDHPTEVIRISYLESKIEDMRGEP